MAPLPTFKSMYSRNTQDMSFAVRRWEDGFRPSQATFTRNQSLYSHNSIGYGPRAREFADLRLQEELDTRNEARRAQALRNGNNKKTSAVRDGRIKKASATVKKAGPTTVQRRTNQVSKKSGVSMPKVIKLFSVTTKAQDALDFTLQKPFTTGTKPAPRQH